MDTINSNQKQKIKEKHNVSSQTTQKPSFHKTQIQHINPTTTLVT